MDLKFGDVQETALIPLAIKASETMRTGNAVRCLMAVPSMESGRRIF